MSAQKANSNSLRQVLEQVLGEETAALLNGIGTAAGDFGCRSFLVGGSVRDLLRGIRGPDIDIMLEGDASAFVEFLKKNWKLFQPSLQVPDKVVHFRKFGTAKLLFSHPIVPGVDQIDFSSARSEVYESSGSAPKVTFADLLADLRRRDFSINALAIELTPSGRGELHDMFEGQSHLQAGELHILHARSFEDDPVRLIRGVRLCTRFGFSFAEETQELFNKAVSGRYLERVPLIRRLDEFRKAFVEAKNREIFNVLHATGLIEQLHPSLESSLPSQAQILSLLEVLTHRAESEWHAWIVSLFSKIPEDDFQRFLKEARISTSEAKLILSLRKSL